MKNPEILHMICGQAEDALNQIAREADLRKPADAEQVKNLVSILAKVDCLMGNSGYSHDGGYSGYYSGAYPDYEQGSSYRRGRNSMGRYTSRDGGYTRMTLEEHLAEMERDATTEERQKIAAMRQMLH